MAPHAVRVRKTLDGGKAGTSNLLCLGESARGVSEQARIILEQSWRQSTKSKYLVYLNKWRIYCETKDENGLERTELC